ncbi:hypothetical protein JYU34_012210 [Plutella xylostella]|uniref:Chitin-binding type-2 domain-containing protein n=1 Tax=Plutella xylostella TaxID=51655 RepID=A0ABQ7QFV0_PLUXY|nr:hypothetical protein JYU34_012210 [Plutella xylostella]
MKTFISIIALLVASAAATQCPTEQNEDWSIELLLPAPDCSKYYQCVHGKPVLRDCPVALFFNPDTLQCDYPEVVECQPIVEEESASSSSESVEAVEEIEFLPNGCPESPFVHWLLPHKLFCRLYYVCDHGRKALRKCPRGLKFNRKLQVCDYPKNARCFGL